MTDRIQELVAANVSLLKEVNRLRAEVAEYRVDAEAYRTLASRFIRGYKNTLGTPHTIIVLSIDPNKVENIMSLWDILSAAKQDHDSTS